MHMRMLGNRIASCIYVKVCVSELKGDGVSCKYLCYKNGCAVIQVAINMLSLTNLLGRDSIVDLKEKT